MVKMLSWKCADVVVDMREREGREVVLGGLSKSKDIRERQFMGSMQG